MTLRDIEYAVAVDRHRHFGRAAEACRVTQSVISTQLAKLEAELGVRLFERTHRKVITSVAGERFVAEGRELLAAAKRLGDTVSPASDGLPGTVRIGIIPTVAPYLLDRVCRCLRKDNPERKLVIDEDKTTELEADLSRGRIDCAILATPPEDSLLSEVILFHEPMFLLVRDDHPLAKTPRGKPVKPPADPLLLLRDGNCLRDTTLAFCRKSRAVRIEDSAATGISQLIALVRAGFGVTMIPEMAVKLENLDGLRALPLATGARRTLRAAYRSTSREGIAMARALARAE